MHLRVISWIEPLATAGDPLNHPKILHYLAKMYGGSSLIEPFENIQGGISNLIR